MPVHGEHHTNGFFAEVGPGLLEWLTAATARARAGAGTGTAVCLLGR